MILDDLLMASDPRSIEDHADVDLCEIASSVVGLAGPQAVERDIHLDACIPDGPVVVKGSWVALLRVGTSLVSNALDYAASVVRVEIRSRGGEAYMVVSDDGPGFTAEFKTRAFERFASSRTNTGDSLAPRHYGLGLTLVAEMAALHRGKVVIGSASSHGGAVVSVVLPLAKT